MICPFSKTFYIVVLSFSGLLLLSSCAEFKEAGRTIGHTTRNVTREIGHGTRDVAKEIGHGTKRVVNSIGEEQPQRSEDENKKPSSASEIN